MENLLQSDYTNDHRDNKGRPVFTSFSINHRREIDGGNSKSKGTEIARRKFNNAVRIAMQ